MAGPNIPPRFVLAGTAHRVEKRPLAATEKLPARDAGNVVVLSDGGGFAEVYYAPDLVHEMPTAGERVLIECEVSVWNRALSNGEGRYSVLGVRFSKAFEVAAAKPPADLHAVKTG